MKRTRIKQLGKKGREWAAVRRKLKVEFEAMGVTRCELKLPGCMVNWAMSFAHCRKRRFLKPDVPKDSPGSLWCCALACQSCHTTIEQLRPAMMEKLVLDAIARRSHGQAEGNGVTGDSAL